MRRIVHTITILGIVLPAIVSCRAISSFLSDDGIVAEVGTEKLYRSELNGLIPNGISRNDSLALVQRYINAWALDRIFVRQAEEQLSKAEKDVTKELEAYRLSLLRYRYEQLYLNERLDTAVAEEKVEEYYSAHQEKFILQRPVVKARYLYIAEDSPSLPKIRKKMSSDKVQDIMDADSMAYSSALKFASWGNEWIDVIVLAREFGMTHSALLPLLDSRWVEHTDTSGMLRLAYISEIMRQGQPAPLEYCSPSIKDMIISARKQDMILSLERDLLNDARENGQFVIFE